MKDIPDIRVIYTGGTIGSEAKDGRVAPAGKASELARRWLAEGGRARITEDRPVEILSENISQDALDRRAAAVRRAVSEGAAGIVLTHGTDTMAYTAAALSYLVQNNAKPVVITGSQKSIFNQDTDARENLRDAIWDSAGEYVSDNALNVYVKRLREKVETDPAEPELIVTVRGLGYKVGE